MFIVLLVAICIACLAGYWWLGRNSTPGQRIIEERVKTMRWSFWSTMSTRFRTTSPEWWTREPEGLRSSVPEPDEHREGWRR